MTPPKPTNILSAAGALVTIALTGQKLDGTLAWPWWSWNPLAGSVLILFCWAAWILLIAAGIVIVVIVVGVILSIRKAAESKRQAAALAEMARRRGGSGE
jgi:hypothetical protein